ncbi:MAG: CDP-diacylglycerol--glycerol-3-phosphate 3-phosphatidyltransferase [Candidatus Tectomicrobia bacterium]|uniref:CDP-diacylglycerol--glycerol-3-phosphate 3-phosphatidyltransferase n=1 Tax=Tectimicrobiota bacterium TaxID=2528274 RepID=A0A937VYV3_UNCTE|nr:CDP-diacylglycerol--glycerol-3-phosphate 3-phosphatidyltransferase [Candidatus Tectomicrobia bacterium]
MALQQSDTPPPLSSQLNWPNKITLVRIFLTPLLLVFLISPEGWYPLVAAVIFLVAAFTDWLDGHLARSTNQITRLGQLLDPIADKLLVTAALVSLVGRQQVPAWMVVIILCRELAVTGLRAMAADQQIIIAADAFGKYKMVCFIAAALLLMLNLPVLDLPGIIILAIGMILSVISGIDYLRKYLAKVL